MQTVAEWLQQQGASGDIVEWSRPYAAQLDRLWSECPRGDWLLAIAARLGAEPRLLVRAACDCARLALAHAAQDEPRLSAALQAAQAWCVGELAEEACAAHRRELSPLLEASTTPAGGAAIVAVVSALDAIWERDAAVNAAAFAAQAAVLSAGDCAMLEALRFTQRRSAQLVREMLPAQRVAELWPITSEG